MELASLTNRAYYHPVSRLVGKVCEVKFDDKGIASTALIAFAPGAMAIPRDTLLGDLLEGYSDSAAWTKRYERCGLQPASVPLSLPQSKKSRKLLGDPSVLAEVAPKPRVGFESLDRRRRAQARQPAVGPAQL